METRIEILIEPNPCLVNAAHALSATAQRPAKNVVTSDYGLAKKLAFDAWQPSAMPYDMRGWRDITEARSSRIQ
jgi:hypothetical protein